MVSVIAEFTCVRDAVAAAVGVTVRTTVGIRRCGIAGTVIALFTGIELTVAAEEGSCETVPAEVREGRIMCRLFALLTEKFLHQSVAADADLKETG